MSCHFEDFSIEKDKVLGHGAYGVVYKAKCGHLPCAAKVVHSTFFVSHDPSARNILQKFDQECTLLEHVKHPNIVLYLGKFTDRASGLPVLLMELLDESLTRFLERQRAALPIRLQLDLSSDIIQAITYLHANGITHRDLSSNNVLINGGRQAKVSDLGMSALLEAKKAKTALPGAEIYMPPEAIATPPYYTKKLDCFSFGVLVIQIATRKFPTPDGRYRDPDDPMPSTTPEGHKMKVLVSEIVRRREHIKLIEPTHEMLPVALDCLKDEHERPTAGQICGRISHIKERVSCESNCDSELEEIQALHAEELAGKDRVIKEKDRMIEEIDRIVAKKHQELEEKDRIIDELVEEKYRNLEEKDEKQRQITDLRRENERISEELKELLIADAMAEEEVINHAPKVAHAKSPLERDPEEANNGDGYVNSKPPQNRAISQPQNHSSTRTLDTRIKLEWRNGVAPPQDMNFGMCTVDDDNNIAYFKDGNEESIWQYVAPTETWEKLPKCHRKAYAWVVMDGALTIVGGLNGNDEELATLISLTGRGRQAKWIESNLNMPTKKFHSACVYCKSSKLLVVAGGKTNAVPSRKVEVLSVAKKQWFDASKLPKSFSNGSAIICQKRLYLVGFLDDHCMQTLAYTCLLSELAPPQSGLLQSIMQTWPPLNPSVRVQWRKIASLPLLGQLATCVSFMGELVVLGGMDEQKLPSDAVYVYNSGRDRWEGDVFTPLSSARYSCLAAVLPQNRLMVVGGQLGARNATASNIVEFAVCMVAT